MCGVDRRGVAEEWGPAAEPARAQGAMGVFAGLTLVRPVRVRTPLAPLQLRAHAQYPSSRAAQVLASSWSARRQDLSRSLAHPLLPSLPLARARARALSRCA